MNIFALIILICLLDVRPLELLNAKVIDLWMSPPTCSAYLLQSYFALHFVNIALILNEEWVEFKRYFRSVPDVIISS